MKQPKLTVEQLLNGIPASYMDGLADDLQCDLHRKKLTSREVFHLLLLGFLNTTPLSWRVLKEHYRGTLFSKSDSPRLQPLSTLARSTNVWKNTA